MVENLIQTSIELLDTSSNSIYMVSSSFHFRRFLLISSVDDRATVREALEFSALLRQDASISREDKLAYVDVVLELLDMTHLQDAIVGSPSAGLNPEQRKRLTIATEVVARPAILFCDEPTTGLDTKSALRVVKLLQRLAKTGLAVIATIHQPVRINRFLLNRIG